MLTLQTFISKVLGKPTVTDVRTTDPREIGPATRVSAPEPTDRERATTQARLMRSVRPSR